MNSTTILLHQNKKKSASVDVKNTQTSKTILQLAEQELKNAMIYDIQIKPRSILNEEIGDTETKDVHFNKKKNIIPSLTISHHFLNVTETEQICQKTKNNKIEPPFLETKNKKHTIEKKKSRIFSPSQCSRFSIREVRIKSFNMDNFQTPTNSDSNTHFFNAESQLDTQKGSLDSFLSMSPKNKDRRSRSLSPTPTHSHMEYDESKSNFTDDSSTVKSIEYGSCIHPLRDKFNILLSNVKSANWDISLKGMMEIADLVEELEFDRLYVSMPAINQRLTEFLRSPRSHVCRISCQIAGRFLSVVKDTRRPEFDEIVDLLLSKTADANKFIRHDANLALDALIMNISAFHSIRAISQKAPLHKNDLVRISCARLMVCIVGLAGAEILLSPPGNETTRKRVIMCMVKFITDKNIRTRVYGIRLYKTLCEHSNFNPYLQKIVSKTNIIDMKKVLRQEIC